MPSYQIFGFVIGWSDRRLACYARPGQSIVTRKLYRTVSAIVAFSVLSVRYLAGMDVQYRYIVGLPAVPDITRHGRTPQPRVIEASRVGATHQAAGRSVKCFVTPERCRV